MERNYANMANATGSVQHILEVNLVDTENAVAPMLDGELQGTRTVPPSRVASIPDLLIARGDRFGNLENPWIRPTTWEQQQQLLRYQLDKDREVEFQRRMEEKARESELRMAEKREVARLKAESDVRAHQLSRDTFDHKQQFRTNSSTRSRSMVRQSAQQDDDPTGKLIHPDWDVKNPTTALQIMAIIVDRFFEKSPRATEAVTMDSFHQLMMRVLEKNSLEFDNIAGFDKSITDLRCYWNNKLNVALAKEVIFLAKKQFPKSVIKQVKGAWDFNAKDILNIERPSIQYMKVRFDQLRITNIINEKI